MEHIWKALIKLIIHPAQSSKRCLITCPCISFQIQNAVKEGFVYGENQDILIVADDCETLFKKLQERAANKEQSTHKILPNI